jgi:hypothetical protein
MRFLVAAVGLGACAQGGAKQGPQDAPEQFDTASPNDAHVDAHLLADSNCPQPMAPGPHLLLSEVALGPGGSEFIEIDNPTAAAVDLANYYLSDSGAYYKLPAGAPGLGTSDFIVKFPAGSMIAAHSVITVATGTATQFMTAYGSAPTYSIADTSIMTVDVNGTPTLTDAGEVIVLFTWDGASPLVFDVDMLLAGIPSTINTLDTARSGYAQLGCTYALDADTLAAQASAPAPGKSTKRIALEAGHETQGGSGNGLTGDDETSEDTSATWDTTATFSTPTPGAVPTAIQ